jgi:hypothetical protein
LGVVVVSFAVVVPTQQLQILEIGRAAARPVHDVMCLTRVGGSVASGGLAVLVAYDERFPDCGWDGARRAADVEDFGSARRNDPADVAVAGDSFERRGREVTVVTLLGTHFGYEFGCVPGEFV